MTDLIATLETASEFDALSKLRPGEPYFVLLGRDKLAYQRVIDWARENRLRALDEFERDVIGIERRDRELRKSTEAEEIAWSMREFKRGDLERKAVGEPTVKTYSGHELPEEVKRRDALQSARIRAVQALNNAVAECSGLVELLRSLGWSTSDLDEANILDDTVGYMRASAEDIAPTRPTGVAA